MADGDEYPEPMIPGNEGAPSRACRYLALAPDPSTIALFACEEHRCFRAGEPLPVALPYQDEVCLRGAHVRCPRYRDAQTLVPLQPRRWPWGRRRWD